MSKEDLTLVQELRSIFSGTIIHSSPFSEDGIWPHCGAQAIQQPISSFIIWTFEHPYCTVRYRGGIRWDPAAQFAPNDVQDYYSEYGPLRVLSHLQGTRPKGFTLPQNLGAKGGLVGIVSRVEVSGSVDNEKGFYHVDTRSRIDENGNRNGKQKIIGHKERNPGFDDQLRSSGIHASQVDTGNIEVALGQRFAVANNLSITHRRKEVPKVLFPVFISSASPKALYLAIPNLKKASNSFQEIFFFEMLGLTAGKWAAVCALQSGCSQLAVKFVNFKNPQNCKIASGTDSAMILLILQIVDIRNLREPKERKWKRRVSCAGGRFPSLNKLLDQILTSDYWVPWP
ncbi:hypothetical protein C8J56DRAFT_880916 [Mycena floridula]|nr:hypothetical protein C8J56DRAFT_880916 [Mycena floridula]